MPLYWNRNCSSKTVVLYTERKTSKTCLFLCEFRPSSFRLGDHLPFGRFRKTFRRQISFQKTESGELFSCHQDFRLRATEVLFRCPRKKSQKCRSRSLSISLTSSIVTPSERRGMANSNIDGPTQRAG